MEEFGGEEPLETETRKLSPSGKGLGDGKELQSCKHSVFDVKVLKGSRRTASTSYNLGPGFARQ